MDPISERLRARHPQRIDLSLERMRTLCAALGDPQHRLPPVIHVAGTNGKGSTVAFIRAIAETAGLRVHAYTSPHLVRFNERIRLGGRLIEDAALNALLDRIEAVMAEQDIEATIREKLPPGFQRAEYLQEKGMVDRVVVRADLPRVLGQILSMLMGGKRRAA